MRRRQFLGLFGSAAACLTTARAQPSPKPVIGLLTSRGRGDAPHLLAAVQHGLAESGFVEGQNVTIEYRFANYRSELLTSLAADLVDRRVDVITAFPTIAAQAAKAVTETIPIVFESAADPIAMGLVKSLNRPEGNLTGVTNLNVEIVPKRLELLREILPTAADVGVILDPTNVSAGPQLHMLQVAAQRLGVPRLYALHANSQPSVEQAFEGAVQTGIQGIVISNDPFFSTTSGQIGALSLQYAMPTVFAFREFVTAGGLLSYGTNIAEAYRQVGVYVGRILRGDRPSELPVQQATEVELMINMRTAKALALNLPLSLLGRANEVVE
jgi:ABC-type uncharacterized transport system substrate-binding protein